MGQCEHERQSLGSNTSAQRGTTPALHTAALGLNDATTGNSLLDPFETSWEAAWIDLGGEG